MSRRAKPSGGFRPFDVVAKHLRRVPPPFDWGLVADDDPRMRLRTLNPERCGEYSYLLERDGRRVLEPEGAPLDEGVFATFAERVRYREGSIEFAWLAWALAKGWLTVGFDGKIVTVTLYPQLGEQSIRRFVDVPEEFPGLAIDGCQPFLDAEEATLVLAQGANDVWRLDLFLPQMLWEGGR
jgi:hypothetical protein